MQVDNVVGDNPIFHRPPNLARQSDPPLVGKRLSLRCPEHRPQLRKLTAESGECRRIMDTLGSPENPVSHFE